ncbi:uncharacterized protein [Haliotis cracherodii]|uniref:uncharacterized protein n=1 Tax=Haliotis cracherodii TaxID=6455 RepID=UPI0039E8E1B0
MVQICTTFLTAVCWLKKDAGCVETITRVPKKACHHLAKPPRWPSNLASKKYLKVHQNKSSVEIIVTRDREPGSTLLLTFHGQGGRQCLNITTPGNQTYAIADGWAKTRLKCRGVRTLKKGLKIKLYDLTNRRRLDSHRLEKRRKKLKKKVTEVPPVKLAEGESRHARTTCFCDIPKFVYLKPVCVSEGNYSVTVSWEPLHKSSDLRVGIVHEGNSDEFVDDGFQKLPIWKLELQHLQKVTFTNLKLDSGSNYIGLVGSLGCDSCMRYKESEVLHVQCSTGASPEPAPTIDVPVSTIPSPPIIVKAVIGVGAFAFIGVLALGVFLLKLRYGKGYGPLPASETSVSLETVARVSVVRSIGDDVARGAENLVLQLEQRGKTTVSSLESDATEVSLSACDLIFYVTDRTDRNDPPCLKQLTSKTVTVLLQGNRNPDVVVPRDFQFGDFLNNQMALGRHLHLEDFLNQVAPDHLDVGPSHVRALLLSWYQGEDDSPHRKATKELIRLMRDQLNMDVVDPQDSTHRDEQRGSGPNNWVRGKVAVSNLIIVVPSSDPLSSNKGGVHMNNVQRINQAAVDCLKQCPIESGPKVCVVTFGYWTEYVESVQKYILVRHTFNLREPDTGDPTSVRHNLRPFFSWLCQDAELVERACREGGEFLFSADRMSDILNGSSYVLEDMV